MNKLSHLNEQGQPTMEALAGASVAALTVYDMCKALVIAETKLIEKSGEKNDFKTI